MIDMKQAAPTDCESELWSGRSRVTEELQPQRQKQDVCPHRSDHMWSDVSNLRCCFRRTTWLLFHIDLSFLPKQIKESSWTIRQMLRCWPCSACKNIFLWADQNSRKSVLEVDVEALTNKIRTFIETLSGFFTFFLHLIQKQISIMTKVTLDLHRNDQRLNIRCDWAPQFFYGDNCTLIQTTEVLSLKNSFSNTSQCCDVAQVFFPCFNRQNVKKIKCFIKERLIIYNAICRNCDILTYYSLLFKTQIEVPGSSPSRSLFVWSLHVLPVHVRGFSAYSPPPFTPHSPKKHLCLVDCWF